MKQLLITIILFLCIGCGRVSVNYISLDEEYRQPQEYIDVYYDTEMIDKKYKEIGYVTATVGNKKSWELIDLLDYLQKEAMKKGADAIIYNQPDHQSNHYNVGIGGPWYFSKTKVTTARAVAIVYIN